jgi:hypothetical protein
MGVVSCAAVCGTVFWLYRQLLAAGETDRVAAFGCHGSQPYRCRKSVTRGYFQVKAGLACIGTEVLLTPRQGPTGRQGPWPTFQTIGCAEASGTCTHRVLQPHSPDDSVKSMMSPSCRTAPARGVGLTVAVSGAC